MNFIVTSKISLVYIIGKPDFSDQFSKIVI